MERRETRVRRIILDHHPEFEVGDDATGDHERIDHFASVTLDVPCVLGVVFWDGLHLFRAQLPYPKVALV